MTHADLVQAAARWLRGIHCGAIVTELVTVNSETPDAVGWRGGVSIMVEAKASRSDFHRDKKKVCRQLPESGIGDWRFYLCPVDVIRESDLPPGWGLLYAEGRRVRLVAGGPHGSMWGRPPFRGCKHRENTLLVSALRRLQAQPRRSP
jgi:hypothetical protein